MIKIKEAQEELAKKSYRDIQEETAWKWASRSCATYQNVITTDEKQKIQLYLLAEEYAHESREHASLTETASSSLLSQINAAISPYSVRAWEEIERVFGV